MNKFKQLVAVALLLMGGNEQLSAQTAGTLSFNVTTIAHTGYSGTKNDLAIWIQDNSGAFVRTYYRYAGGGTADHLPTWSVNAGGTSGNCLSANCNVVGATTGATLTGAVTKSLTWNGTNSSGVLVADGVYKVTIQETWNHGTSGTTTRSFTFTKGPTQDVQSPAADANFTGISLQWTPTPPTASFTTSATLACVGQSIQLTSTSTGSPTSYQWTMTGGNPTSSTTQNPTVVYATPGTYQVSLVATNNVGSSTPAQQTIIVNAIPTIQSTTTDTICGVGVVALQASASAGTISWYAAPTGGTSLGTGTNFTSPTLTATTTYYVQSSASGCTSPRTAIEAVVLPGPSVNSVLGDSICGSGALSLTATPSAGTIDWYATSTGGTSLGTGTTFTTPSLTNTTTYYAEANTGNCPSSRVAVIAFVQPNPTVSCAAVVDTVCIYANAFNITGATPAGGTFSGVGVSSNQFDPAVAGLGSQTIVYSVTVNGCSAADSAIIVVDGCAGIKPNGTLDIMVFPNPASSILNLTGAGLEQLREVVIIDLSGHEVKRLEGVNLKTIDVSNLATGTYQLKLIGKNNQGVMPIEIKR
jgi:PKD repeat protein